MQSSSWSKSSWRGFPVEQSVAWSDHHNKEAVLERLSTLPALVFAGETRALRGKLADVCDGKRFILQCGDCAEEFHRCNGSKIHDYLRTFLQMSTIVNLLGETPIVNIGRIAGQYAKPRSSQFEIKNGIEVPIYRGDMVNSLNPTLEEREPDPRRMLEAYFHSAATLNLIRGFISGGYASLSYIHDWMKHNAFEPTQELLNLSERVEHCLKLLDVSNMHPAKQVLSHIDFYSSHEALILEFEEALTRVDTTTGQWYNTSAHFLWIGERTRQLNGAHIEFLRGLENPIGLKLGPNYEIDEILKVIDQLNPENLKGKLTIITRMGHEGVQDSLPPLLSKVVSEGKNVVWVCDPMHGNTYKTSSGVKTRNYDHISGEIEHFFEIHRAESTYPGGVHLEMTSDKVTECIGGTIQIKEEVLQENYLSACDPRLNNSQSIEIALEIASNLKSQ